MPSRPCLKCGARVYGGESYCAVHRPIKRPSPSSRVNRPRRARKLRAAVIAGAGRTCELCGAANVRLEVHHVKAIQAGGKHEPANLMVLCVSCHVKVGKEAHRAE